VVDVVSAPVVLDVPASLVDPLDVPEDVEVLDVDVEVDVLVDGSSSSSPPELISPFELSSAGSSPASPLDDPAPEPPSSVAAPPQPSPHTSRSGPHERIRDDDQSKEEFDTRRRYQRPPSGATR